MKYLALLFFFTTLFLLVVAQHYAQLATLGAEAMMACREGLTTPIAEPMFCHEGAIQTNEAVKHIEDQFIQKRFHSFPGKYLP